MYQVYWWAIERGQKVENPAELVRSASIAKLTPSDRALTPEEIGLVSPSTWSTSARPRRSAPP